MIISEGLTTTPDWIEIQNVAPGDFDLSGYQLINDRRGDTAWRFPAGAIVPGQGFLIVYASDIAIVDRGLDETGRYHTDFKLSLNDEYLAIADPTGQVIDELEYPDQVPDVSYGRASDGSLGFLTAATPGAANGAKYAGLTADTRFSIDRGFFDEPFEVEVTTSDPLTSIYYSFDGTVPTPETGIAYAGPIAIDRTTTLRAAAYRDGYLTPNIDTQTYIFTDQVINQTQTPQTGPTSSPVDFPTTWNRTRADYELEPQVTQDPLYANQMREALTSLPSLSITLPMEEIFESGGLYSNPQRTDETSTSAELIFPDGSDGFQIDSGLRMQGGASRNPEHYKHSMSLRFREDYGAGQLEFPMFEGSEVNSFDSLHLRARYNNSWIHWNPDQRNRGTMMREMFMRDSMLAMGEADAGHGRYVHLYLNGLYWGVYEMHERQDAEHFAAYNGGEAFEYDATNANVAVDGTRDSLDAITDVISNVGELGWEAVTAALDVDNQIRYKILMEYGGNQDIKNDGNWRTAGGGTAGAPVKFYIWDAERVLENPNQRGTQPVRDLLNIFNRLDEHPEYIIRFADILHDVFFNDGALTPEQTAGRWSERKSELDVAIIAESARWGDMRQPRTLTRADNWQPEHDRLLNDYFPRRSEVVMNQFRNSIYPDTEAPEFLVSGERQTRWRAAVRCATVGAQPKRQRGHDLLHNRRIGSSPDRWAQSVRQHKFTTATKLCSTNPPMFACGF